MYDYLLHELFLNDVCLLKNQRVWKSMKRVKKNNLSIHEVNKEFEKKIINVLSVMRI